MYILHKNYTYKKSDFWSRWWHRQTWLASLHNHIKITTKIWNNHHSGTLEIELNGSLTTMELKKPYPPRQVGGAQMRTRLVPNTHVVDENSGEISQKQGVPTPHQAPKISVPVPGR